VHGCRSCGSSRSANCDLDRSGRNLLDHPRGGHLTIGQHDADDHGQPGNRHENHNRAGDNHRCGDNPAGDFLCERKSNDERYSRYRHDHWIGGGDRPFDLVWDNRLRKRRRIDCRRWWQGRFSGISGSPGDGNRRDGARLVTLPTAGRRRIGAFYCRHRSVLRTLSGLMRSTRTRHHDRACELGLVSGTAPLRRFPRSTQQLRSMIRKRYGCSHKCIKRMLYSRQYAINAGDDVGPRDGGLRLKQLNCAETAAQTDIHRAPGDRGEGMLV
jgi:hypothetical protein